MFESTMVDAKNIVTYACRKIIFRGLIIFCYLGPQNFQTVPASNFVSNSSICIVIEISTKSPSEDLIFLLPLPQGKTILDGLHFFFFPLSTRKDNVHDFLITIIQDFN